MQKNRASGAPPGTSELVDGLSVGVVCSIGLGPQRGGRATNDDNYLLCRDGEVRYREGEGEVVRQVQGGAGVMLVVADGLGPGGGLASSAAVQALGHFYARGRPEAPELALHRFVLNAHRRIRERLVRSGPVAIGTTLTVAWLLGDRLFWLHVGDSRLYLYRRGVLNRLTRDHTRGEFALRDRRRMPADAGALAQSFVYGSRGLGNDASIRIDPGRDTGSLRLLPGDTLLLATDGLTRFVDDYRLAWALQEVPGAVACAEVLYERAIAQGSDDNVTVMVAKVRGGAAAPGSGS